MILSKRDLENVFRIKTNATFKKLTYGDLLFHHKSLL